jgi:hypothetical protein
MAIHAHSTPVPAPQRGLLRAFAHPCDLAANRREMPGSCPPDQLSGNPGILPAVPLADPESTAAQPCNASGLAPKEALASTALAALLEPAEAAEARALHRHRALIQAVEHGFALLDALDLPPVALDTIDQAIASLDAIEVAGEDMEDDDPAEETSLETAGRGFVRCGADDEEEDDGCERGEEYGSEDAEDIGHHASQFRPRPLTRDERDEIAVIAARAATLRRALHVCLPLVGGSVALLGKPAAAAMPIHFDAAAFVADLAAAGYSVIAHRSVPRGGEKTSTPSYVIQPSRSRGFEGGYLVVMARWTAAMDSCPDHVERVVAYVFGQPGAAQRGTA